MSSTGGSDKAGGVAAMNGLDYETTLSVIAATQICKMTRLELHGGQELQDGLRFCNISAHAALALGELLREYILEIGVLAQNMASHGGRAESNFDDVAAALETMSGTTVSDIADAIYRQPDPLEPANIVREFAGPALNATSQGAKKRKNSHSATSGGFASPRSPKSPRSRNRMPAEMMAASLTDMILASPLATNHAIIYRASPGAEHGEKHHQQTGSSNVPTFLPPFPDPNSDAAAAAVAGSTVDTAAAVSAGSKAIISITRVAGLKDAEQRLRLGSRGAPGAELVDVSHGKLHWGSVLENTRWSLRFDAYHFKAHMLGQPRKSRQHTQQQQPAGAGGSGGASVRKRRVRLTTESRAASLFDPPTDVCMLSNSDKLPNPPPLLSKARLRAILAAHGAAAKNSATARSGQQPDGSKLTVLADTKKTCPSSSNSNLVEEDDAELEEPEPVDPRSNFEITPELRTRLASLVQVLMDYQTVKRNRMTPIGAEFVEAPILVPGYTEYVKNPMDLKTLAANLESGKYRNIERFEAAFDLIINNCKLFNGHDAGNMEGGGYYIMCAKSLHKKFNKEVDMLRKKWAADEAVRQPRQKSENCDRRKTANPLKVTLSLGGKTGGRTEHTGGGGGNGISNDGTTRPIWTGLPHPPSILPGFDIVAESQWRLGSKWTSVNSRAGSLPMASAGVSRTEKILSDSHKEPVPGSKDATDGASAEVHSNGPSAGADVDQGTSGDGPS